MADILRPGDHGLVGGGPGPTGQADARVALVPGAVAPPRGVVLGQDYEGGGGGGPDTGPDGSYPPCGGTGGGTPGESPDPVVPGDTPAPTGGARFADFGVSNSFSSDDGDDVCDGTSCGGDSGLIVPSTVSLAATTGGRPGAGQPLGGGHLVSGVAGLTVGDALVFDPGGFVGAYDLTSEDLEELENKIYEGADGPPVTGDSWCRERTQRSKLMGDSYLLQIMVFLSRKYEKNDLQNTLLGPALKDPTASGCGWCSPQRTPICPVQPRGRPAALGF